jgi:hypothetical protein
VILSGIKNATSWLWSLKNNNKVLLSRLIDISVPLKYLERKLFRVKTSF